MKPTFLLSDEAETNRLMLKDVPFDDLPVRDTEAHVGCNCDRWGQTPWLEVHPEEAIPVSLDGEPLRFSRVRYEAVPKAIQLILPPNCQLLAR